MVHPRKADTDGDRLSDAKEDRDKDGLSNLNEQNRGTHPNKVDTDGDGFTDRGEVLAGGRDPRDPASHPSTDTGGPVAIAERGRRRSGLRSSAGSHPAADPGRPAGSGSTSAVAQFRHIARRREAVHAPHPDHGDDALLGIADEGHWHRVFTVERDDGRRAIRPTHIGVGV